MKILLHIIATTTWTVAFAGTLMWFNLHGYYAGYWVGVFAMIYCYVGLDLINFNKE